MTYFGIYHDQEVELSKDWSSSNLADVLDQIIYKVDQLEDVTAQTYAAVFDMSRPEGDRMIARLSHDQDSRTSILSVSVTDITASQLDRMKIDYQKMYDGSNLVFAIWTTVR